MTQRASPLALSLFALCPFARLPDCESHLDIATDDGSYIRRVVEGGLGFDVGV